MNDFETVRDWLHESDGDPALVEALDALDRIEARSADFFDLIRDLQAKHDRLRAEVEEWKQAGRKRAEKAEAERDRLREALKEIANAIPQDVRPKFKDIARRALEGSE